MIWYLALFYLLIVIVVHEFGHYIAFRIFGFKPTFRVTWWGAILIGENCHYKPNPKQMIVIALSGILLGLIPLILLIPSNEFLRWLFIYGVLMSGLDWISIYQVTTYTLRYSSFNQDESLGLIYKRGMKEILFKEIRKINKQLRRFT